MTYAALTDVQAWLLVVSVAVIAAITLIQFLLARR